MIKEVIQITTTDTDRLINSWDKKSIGFIQLNRPHKANAYNRILLEQIDRQFEAYEKNPDIHVIVICSTGSRSFCAGADFSELKQRDYNDAFNLLSANVFERIASGNKITIAAINGAAAGGGLELSLTCDFRIASDTARFSFPETKMGLIPAAGGTQRLTQVVGPSKARELILAGKIWSAHEALHNGLINFVSTAQNLSVDTDNLCREIVERDPLALQLAKKAINLSTSNPAGLRFESVCQALLYHLKFNHP
jgi:enoyl-CoA hydratase